mmetsp:Transcript_5163/g.11455  ORF Transcript_5163/g.11455 Transcript_5163/m.11455 type:complete len:232 (+) Transcript_5163:30-725(+)
MFKFDKKRDTTAYHIYLHLLSLSLLLRSTRLDYRCFQKLGSSSDFSSVCFKSSKLPSLTTTPVTTPFSTSSDRFPIPRHDFWASIRLVASSDVKPRVSINRCRASLRGTVTAQTPSTMFSQPASSKTAASNTTTGRREAEAESSPFSFLFCFHSSFDRSIFFRRATLTWGQTMASNSAILDRSAKTMAPSFLRSISRGRSSSSPSPSSPPTAISDRPKLATTSLTACDPGA